MSFPLFGEPDVPPQAAILGPKLKAMAEKEVYFGTSSWKYPGWIGGIYSEEKYVTRGKFSKAKFEERCLEEYARTFPVVGGDFAFYRFQTAEFWRKFFDGSPRSLSFGLKVPEDLTVAKFPEHARYGIRGGQPNSNFLDAELFKTEFLRLLEPYVSRVAVLMFEFGTFAKSTFPRPEDFLARLDTFLARLPAGFRYAIEIRNPEYLVPEYFSMLASHQVAHVFNAWTRMPELGDQIAMPGSITSDFIVARALLTKGQMYEDAVNAFDPYERVQRINPGAREGLEQLVNRAIARKKPAFLFVNNRLEGNAPSTIEAVVDTVLRSS